MPQVETKATEYLRMGFITKGSDMQLLMQSDPSLSKKLSSYQIL
jgi:hypothetical protein